MGLWICVNIHLPTNWMHFFFWLAKKILAFDHVSQVAAAQSVTYGYDVVFVLKLKKNTFEIFSFKYSVRK